MADQVVVRTFSYRHEAEFYRSVLDGHGICAVVRADDAGAVHPALALAGGVRLCVAEADAAQASEILDSCEAPCSEDANGGGRPQEG